ncbi:hypothetical protein [Okeania sp. SIO2G5]|uniref:hypothetical protein n=1 Tax=Okeania sp. SIO2G5 TaxID=2607796 RepID=UPI00338DFBB2
MSQPNEFPSSSVAQTESSLKSNPSEPSSVEEKSTAESKAEIAVSMDKDLLRQITFLTDDPSKVIEAAVRQWLREGGRRDDDLTRNLERNPPVPARGEWND